MAAITALEPRLSKFAMQSTARRVDTINSIEKTVRMLNIFMNMAIEITNPDEVEQGKPPVIGYERRGHDFEELRRKGECMGTQVQRRHTPCLLVACV
jgi:hypothetical protein